MMTAPALGIASLWEYISPATPLRPDLECAHAPSISALGLTNRQAEDLLDWLEAHGRDGAHVSFVPGEGFTVES